jgi:uncharacterized membrane protein YdjX (TVP38/TMEM64 family)
VYVAVTASSLPFATALTLLGGAVFGRWMATGLVSLGATLGACGAMLLSRFLLRDWVTRRFGDRLEPIQAKINTEGRYYLFALRLTPIVPFFVVNLAIGLTRMSVPNFAWVSCIGMLPGIWIYANAVPWTSPSRNSPTPSTSKTPTTAASISVSTPVDSCV